MPQPRAQSRRRAAQPLADLVIPLISPALARQGFSEADVLVHWAAIVGDQLAERCRPVKLQWRRRPADPAAAVEPATLVVRVEGAFAVTLQHVAPVVIERVNAYFGWRCVGKLAMKQGPLPAVDAPKASRRSPDSVARARAAAEAVGVDDERLHAALVALGSHVLAR